jgi:predicted Zn finger-like uncharacterized protein
MEVQCERCKTDYEFDDALVSGRGTTVKCTNCGHQFKIRRDDGSEDRWVIQMASGEEAAFASLRELQKAIISGRVRRTDMLLRGEMRRELATIAELGPFFQSSPPPAPEDAPPTERNKQASKPPVPPGASQPPLVPPQRSRATTRHDFLPPVSTPPPPGLQAAVPPSVPPSVPPPPSKRPSIRPVPVAIPRTPPPPAVSRSGPPPSPAARSAAGPQSDMVPPDSRRSTLPEFVVPPRSAAPPSTMPSSDTSQRADEEPEPSTNRMTNAASEPPQSAHRPPSVASVPPPPRRVRTPETSTPLPPVRYEVPSADFGTAGMPDSEFDVPPMSRGRRPVGGMVVAAVVAGCVLVMGGFWFKNSMRTASTASRVDPRVAELLAAGDKALQDGNLDSAKESFDKATALSEKEPKLLLSVARLASSRADVQWLRMRLLAPDAADDARVTRESLGDLSQRARKAADDAIAVAPEDPAALRAKIDALRISGERDQARGFVAKIIGAAQQPETAYVLAVLDLAEPEPLWQSVIERLRTAAAADGGGGRARAMLVYALARSGDPAQARQELDRLAALPRPHPLLGLLRAFVDHAPGRPKTLDGGVSPDTLKDAHVGAGGTRAVDPRALISLAEAAKQRGDFDKARTLFSQALDKNPQDSEALNGLAEIAYASRDLGAARSAYKRVLATNGGYLPALVGLADVEWEAGDRATAAKLYKDITDRFPEGAYPARVKQRIEAAAPATPSTAAAPTASAAVPEAPKAPEPPKTAPTAAPEPTP